MEQLFAFKKDSSVFRFFLSPEKDVYVRIEGRTDSITPQLLVGFLVKKGINIDLLNKEGILKALSRAMSESTELSDPILIAQAVRPSESKIVFKVDASANPLITRGSLIAIIEQTEGEAVDPFGKPITAAEAATTLPVLKNVIFNSGDNGLYATETGVLVVNEGAIRVFPEIEVELSEDFFTASISICSMRPIEIAQMKEALVKKGITYGVDDSALNLLSLKTREKAKTGKIIIEKSVPVAFGLRDIQGKDGWIQWLVNVEKKVELVEDEQGRVDFKQTNLIKSVKEGTSLAVIHQPEKGRVGFKVTGDSVDSAPGKEAKIKKGKGVVASADGSILLAASDGAVNYSNGTLSVEQLFSIEHSVDYSVGNVLFDGKIVVGEHIVAGFTVEATGDITVKGTIYGQLVRSGGAIQVQEGIAGNGVSLIETAEGISSHYINEATLISGGNIIVTSQIKDSTVTCWGSIIIKEAGISGGATFVNRGLMCSVLGAKVEVPTRITSGLDYITYLKVQDLIEKARLLENDISKVENDISLVKDDEANLEMLRQEYEFLIEEKKVIDSEISAVTGGYALEKPVNKIVVLDTLYPNVFIEMRGIKKLFKQAVKGPVLIYYNAAENQIAMRSLPAQEITLLKKRFEHFMEQDETGDSH